MAAAVRFNFSATMAEIANALNWSSDETDTRLENLRTLWMDKVGTRFSIGNPEEIANQVANGGYVAVDVSNLVTTKIGICFASLVKDRESLETQTEKVRKEARTRGFWMVVGQLASGAGYFLPYAKKNFLNKYKKVVGLGIYEVFMVMVGVLILMSLIHLMKDFGKLKKYWKTGVNELYLRITEFKLICGNETAISNANMQAAENLIRDRIDYLSAPLNFGYMGTKLVWLEMALAGLALVSLPIIATFSRIS